MALYLIAGIAGFIGSSLARELIRQGYAVRSIDNLSTSNLENLASIRDKIEFSEANLLDLPVIDRN